MNQAPVPWINGTEPARALWALGTALTLTAVAIDHLLSQELTFFFDLCFVSICVLLAVRIRHGEFYSAAVMPPVLLFGTVIFLALVSPATVADEGDGVVQAFVSGLAHHAVGFAAGFAATLGVLQWRSDTDRTRRESQPSGE